MENATFRSPDKCPVHPESGAVRADTWGTRGDGKAVRHRLVQYRCAEECKERLGWEYHSPQGEFRHGPGRCRETELLDRIGQAKFSERHDENMMYADAIILAAGGFGISLVLAGAIQLAPLVVPAILATGAGSLWWLRRKSLNRKPEPRGDVPGKNE